MEKPETSFKDMNAKQKMGYIWDYYKLLLFAIVIIIGILIYVIYVHFHPGAESICNVALVDTESYGSDDDVFADYLEEKGYDTELYTINTTFFDTSVYTSQLLTAELMTGEVDIIIGSSTVMQNLLDSEALASLDDWLDDESDSADAKDTQTQGDTAAAGGTETEKDTETAENAEMAEDTETAGNTETAENTEDEIEKLTGTDSDGNEHVYAIRLPEGNEIIYDGYYTKNAWVGISASAENADEALKVLEYLMTVQDHSIPYADMTEFLEALTETEE